MRANPLNPLFVDTLYGNDEDFGEGCARGWERKGYRVAQSTCGQDGIELCRHYDFDIAILDMELVWIVTATNRNMESRFPRGTFATPCPYRVNVIPSRNPPLALPNFATTVVVK
ncbi:hypothetical protein Pla52o_39710 [Novipirellula galeiformis]|uniref:Response regulatory domain-containing protein n=1 Tax=Novipirellula galeiformis TaxID=2528004 RepID=A0A5C6C8P5_9BACT|nr:hypothetical protein [Novipirellula galeiformis]TWU20940.1 hypothetical protein Pla52o_39710 [Novipirellula galeiformis]